MKKAAGLVFVLLAVTSVAAFGAVEVTLLEPQTCVRTAGADDLYTYNFPALDGSAVLTVQNVNGGRRCWRMNRSATGHWSWLGFSWKARSQKRNPANQTTGSSVGDTCHVDQVTDVSKHVLPNPLYFCHVCGYVNRYHASDIEDILRRGRIGLD